MMRILSRASGPAKRMAPWVFEISRAMEVIGTAANSVSEAKAGNGDAPPQKNPPQEEPELPPEAEGDAADDARVAANNLPINNVPDPAIPPIPPIMRSDDDEEDENASQADGVDSNSRMESTDAQTDGTLNDPNSGAWTRACQRGRSLLIRTSSGLRSERLAEVIRHEPMGCEKVSQKAGIQILVQSMLSKRQMVC